MERFLACIERVSVDNEVKDKLYWKKEFSGRTQLMVFSLLSPATDFWKVQDNFQPLSRCLGSFDAYQNVLFCLRNLVGENFDPKST